MRLRALDLHRVPGIDRHFRIEASTEPGVVNIVTGRNASGKSTLLRVMRGLLYPRQYTDHTWRAAGEFVDEAGHSLTVLNTGGTTSWSDGTHAIAAPSLPEARFAGCYMLEFEDIAGRHAASEEALAQRIARELTGGYDLKAVGELFPAKTSRAKTLASELDKAETERSQVQREHNSLREKENRLDTLQAELASAEATAAQLSAIRDAEAYREARRQLEEIDAQLAAMPEGMGRLTGDDREQLEQIDEALRSARQRETTAADQRQDADQQLAASGLATAALDADALSEPREQCHAIGRAEDQRDQANQLLREQQAALAERTKQLGGATGADPGPVTADDVRSASESLASWREQKNRERQLELALEGLPGDDPATTRTEALREARHALRRWLAAAAAAGTASRQWLDWLALGIPLALASAVAAIQGHPALLGLLLLGAAAVGIRWWRSAPDAPLKTVQAQFNTTGVTPP